MSSRIQESEEMYCLRWESHKSVVDLSKVFQDFRENEVLFDVSLGCSIDDGGSTSLKAHKLVLSAYSPVFKDMFTRLREKNDTFIYLKGISRENLSYMLDFMYQGSIDIPKSQINSFLSDAHEFQIKGLDVKENSIDDPPSNEHPENSRYSSSSTPKPFVNEEQPSKLSTNHRLMRESLLGEQEPRLKPFMADYNRLDNDINLKRKQNMSAHKTKEAGTRNFHPGVQLSSHQRDNWNKRFKMELEEPIGSEPLSYEMNGGDNFNYPKSSESTKLTNEKNDKPSMKSETQDTNATHVTNKKTKSKKTRRPRCFKCTPCQSENCGVCSACKDMPKFGGRGLSRKACLKRICIDPLRKPRTEESLKRKILKEAYSAPPKTEYSETSQNLSDPLGQVRGNSSFENLDLTPDASWDVKDYYTDEGKYLMSGNQKRALATCKICKYECRRDNVARHVKRSHFSMNVSSDVFSDNSDPLISHQAYEKEPISFAAESHGDETNEMEALNNLDEEPPTEETNEGEPLNHLNDESHIDDFFENINDRWITTGKQKRWLSQCKICSTEVRRDKRKGHFKGKHAHMMNKE